MFIVIEHQTPIPITQEMNKILFISCVIGIGV